MSIDEDDSMEVDEFPLVVNHHPFTFEDIDAKSPATVPNAIQSGTAHAATHPTMRWERAALWSTGTLPVQGSSASASAKSSAGPRWEHTPLPALPGIGAALAKRIDVKSFRSCLKSKRKRRNRARKKARAVRHALLADAKTDDVSGNGAESKGKARKRKSKKKGRAKENTDKQAKATANGRMKAVKRRLAELARRIGGPPIKGLHDLASTD
ncbi:hypothetical protein A1Q1_03025 [Trichosporon asahii var. asahii CBS 2479]|uniref:Uncharacterized protein n=1 Tax=Trichosporon asahii var. asahii (strain ATCC 90039 / CBS 2479 / JCM 2466 / KCTC 7840 / NBRC 103889/ NCYC 2677 / UAMH 7654) TaxID=1186058 RepID=J6EYT4_TRIAS|nr:hypothetical protein A1Q1_03025 [Trichosporon asahii var. asahii CBS 2479]EJT47987.1 hypothetical protein A1Q1_03025 [Trichosporon asahii var. asahii CBS 2479]